MITFWILATILIGSAIFVITASKPVHAVLALLVNFFAIAALYVTLSAEFLAVTQILVYSGAILVLFLFVIALLSSGIGTVDLGPDRLAKLPATVLLALTAILVSVLAAASHNHLQSLLPGGITVIVPPVGTADTFGSVADFGSALFTKHILPFELTALILLIAIIGVIMIAGERDGLTPPPLGSAAPPKRRKREPIYPGGER